MSEPRSESKQDTVEAISFATFLEEVSPSTWRDVRDLWSTPSGATNAKKIREPDLLLYCSTKDVCERKSYFRCYSSDQYFQASEKNTFLEYRCSNCQEATKKYSLILQAEDGGDGRCYKYGEHPQFGFATPARLQRLFQSDRELFMKGRNCEIHSLGIGAFVYYRRVVENHKNDIFNAIIRVAQTLNAPSEMIATLNAAKKEKQFSNAMESVRDAIPSILYIKGANPITLLHSALSLGLHAESDAKCLEYAHDVRLVLIELSERLGQVLTDDAELNDAVTRLLKLRQQTEGGSG